MIWRIETVGTTDNQSGGSCIAVCGVAEAKVVRCRVGIRKLQQGNNYALVEDLNLLQIMEEVLPVTNKERNSVAKQHNESNPDFNWVGERNEDSVCRRYCTFYQKCAPTGDPQCAENVQMAKHIAVKFFNGQKKVHVSNVEILQLQ